MTDMCPRFCPKLLSCLMILIFMSSSQASWADNVFISTRMGIGPTFIKSPEDSAIVKSQHVTLRLSVLDFNNFLLAGFDFTSYRLDSTAKLKLMTPSMGNDARLFLGTKLGNYVVWLAKGAGELRIADRPAPDQAKPHRFLNFSQEIGASYDIYRAEYGKIEICGLFRQSTPEKTWQQTYNLRKIETWQFDIGFKLLDL